MAASYPRVPRDVIAVPTAAGVAVYSRSAALLLEGADARLVVEAIFPLLDGSRTTAEVLAAVPHVDASELRSLIDELREHGLLSESASRASRDCVTEAEERFRSARVLVLGEHETADGLARAIRAAGVRNVSVDGNEARAPDLAVVVFGADTGEAAVRLARAMFDRGVRTLPCVLRPGDALIGPLSRAGAGPCWNCAALRMRANEAWADREDRPYETVAGIDAVFAMLVSREVCDALGDADGDSRLAGQVLALDRASLHTSLHQVIAVPGCSVCGGPAAVRAGGDDRQGIAAGPDMLAQQLMSWFVDSRTGIIHRIVLEDTATTGVLLPIVATAVPADAPDSQGGRRSIPAGWGKGMTVAEAAVSAIGEAIERYAASMPDSTRIAWSRPSDLAGEVLRPDAFALYDERRYLRADFPLVRFDPYVAHPWVAGEWVGSGASVWVPAILSYLALDVRNEHRFCQGTSNGLAAGIDRSEAALRAVLELLERDTFMASWMAREAGRRIRLDDTLDPDLRSIVDGIGALGARVEVVLLRSVVGYPTAVALAFGDGIRWPGVTLGLATDPDPRTAVRQAILELGQTGPYLRQLMLQDARPAPVSAADVADMIDHARYYFSPERAAALDYLVETPDVTSLRDLPDAAERSLRALASRMAAAGVRVALVDVTSSDIATRPVWVMRAVSPDLQPISFGHGFERLPVARLAGLDVAAGFGERIAPIW